MDTHDYLKERKKMARQLNQSNLNPVERPQRRWLELPDGQQRRLLRRI